MGSVTTDTGASSVEYALLAAGIAAVLAVAAMALGPMTLELFTHTCDRVDTAMAATASCS